MNYQTLDTWLGLKIDPKVVLAQVIRDTKVTFSDNMDEPVHRWFRFPAGFSAELAKRFLELFSHGRSLVLDPFTGSGTTNVVAKTLGLPSLGVERHPLLAWIAKTKTECYALNELCEASEKILERAKAKLAAADESDYDLDSKPELLHKCYPKRTLCELYALKDLIDSMFEGKIHDFFTLALLCILRKVTEVDVGWPYILPKKKKRTAQPVYEAFRDQVMMMLEDLKKLGEKINVRAEIYEADARNMKSIIDDESVDIAFTSPPYLNNYDYADRTRLELYFLGWASSWHEIAEKVRKKLIVSCSHQAKEMGLPEGLTPDKDIPEDVSEALMDIAEHLRIIKQTRGGRKDYDIMIVAYFNDMTKTLKEMYRVLKSGAYYGMVLGDSAPYGVHIPTDEYLAKIGTHVGFSEAKIYVLRERGGKWKYLTETGRRHAVRLRESLILFRK